MQAPTDRYSKTMIVRTRGRLLARALALLFAAAAASALVAQLLRPAMARDFTAAPDFVLKSTTGGNVRLSEYRTEVVAIAFWTSWCSGCREQLPMLERVQQSLGEDGFRVLSVSFDDDPEATRQAAEAARVSFPVLMDPDGEAGRLYDVNALPLVVVVDREGRLRGSYEGEAGEQALVSDLRALLAEQ